MTTLEQMGAKAKDASRFLMTAGSKKDIALGAIADALCENCEEILAANKIDLENGEKSGLTASLLDRLRLSEERINGMADGVRQVAALPDPVGRVLDGRTLKNGLQIEKVTVPETGLISPLSILKRVVLPTPLAPIKPTLSLSSTSNETSVKRFLSIKVIVRFLTDNAGKTYTPFQIRYPLLYIKIDKRAIQN
jgi:hypothetical protein